MLITVHRPARRGRVDVGVLLLLLLLLVHLLQRAQSELLGGPPVSGYSLAWSRVLLPGVDQGKKVHNQLVQFREGGDLCPFLHQLVRQGNNIHAEAAVYQVYYCIIVLQKQRYKASKFPKCLKTLTSFPAFRWWNFVLMLQRDPGISTSSWCRYLWEVE